jgi:hypothetical protein
MIRWFILFCSLLLWSVCMAAVYIHTRPTPTQEALLGAEEGFKILFADDAETIRSWKLYADFTLLQPGSDKQAPIAWDGVNEASLISVGKVSTEMKRKSDSRIEQLTHVQFRIPPESRMSLPDQLNMFTIRIGCDYTYETGLDTLSLKASTGLGYRAEIFGMRNGNELMLTQQILQNRTKLFENRERLVLGTRSAPSTELTPFQRQREIRIGMEWDIAMLDPRVLESMAVDTEKARPRMVSRHARCTKKTTVILHGQVVTVFVAETDDGKARAWYSADGAVLKQTYRMADAFDIMLVRTHPDAKGVRDASASWTQVTP